MVLSIANSFPKKKVSHQKIHKFWRKKKVDIFINLSAAMHFGVPQLSLSMWQLLVPHLWILIVCSYLKKTVYKYAVTESAENGEKYNV